MRYMKREMEQVGRSIITRYFFKDGRVKVYKHKVDRTHPRARRGKRNMDLFKEIEHLSDEVVILKKLVHEIAEAWK